MRNNIYAFCPICEGHCEYSALGLYAARVVIKIDGKREAFDLDDMFGDGDKLRKRVKELRANQPIKVNVTIYDSN